MYITRFCSYFKAFGIFFNHLLHPTYRVTVDVYALMFICDFITCIIVVFGYWAFGSGGEGGVTEYFQENKVPVPFITMLIVQFMLIIIDRALFLRKQILGKFIFQYVLVLCIHLWMFMILPMVTGREFVKNIPAQLWYFTKCIYFLFSAYQIRSGYPTRILGNFLTKKYNYMNLFLFKGFMLIPFLMEVRSLMDWMWTDTSMSLSSWLKIEDIYAKVFVLKCWRQSELEYPTPRGHKCRSLIKYGLGGTYLLFIILIIWFPLVLFALANTVGVRNLPVECSFQVSIGEYQPIYKMSAQHRLMQPLSPAEYQRIIALSIFKNDMDAQSFFSTYDAADVIKIQFDGNSTSLWSISPPSLQSLIETLSNQNNNVTVKAHWECSRAATSPLQTDILDEDHSISLFPLSQPRENLIKLLKGNKTATVVLENVFPKFIQLPSNGKASAITVLCNLSYQNFTGVQLFLHQAIYDNFSRELYWWQIQEKHPKVKNINFKVSTPTKLVYPEPYFTLYNSDYIQIFAFTDKVFPSSFSFITAFGIIGLYVSLVLVVSRFMRMMFTGISHNIMFEELPNVDRILQLCLDIFLVRESGELYLEEDLFSKLIFLYRSPETMIKWTKFKQP